MAPAAAAAAPFQPGAHRGAIPAGSCRVSLFAAPHEIASGESAQLFGRVRCAADGGVGQTVTVYERAVGSSAFTTLGTTTAGADGLYSIVAPALTSDTLFYASAASTRSTTKAVKVAPVVTVAGPTEGSQSTEGAALLTGPGHRVTFTGAVSPADAGAVVVLQRQNVRVASAGSNNGARFSSGSSVPAASTRSPTRSCCPATPTCAC